MRVTETLETCLYAADLDAAERFYSSVLGLEMYLREAGRHVFFRCGHRMLLIFDPNRTTEDLTSMPAHGALGPVHVAFAVAQDELPAWRQHLARHGVGIEAELAWPTGGRSLYFRDPAGNSVELASPRIWSIAEADCFGHSTPAEKPVH